MLTSIVKVVAQVFLAGAGAYAVAYGLGGASESIVEAAKTWSDGSSETGFRAAANG